MFHSFGRCWDSYFCRDESKNINSNAFLFGLFDSLKDCVALTCKYVHVYKLCIIPDLSDKIMFYLYPNIHYKYAISSLDKFKKFGVRNIIIITSQEHKQVYQMTSEAFEVRLLCLHVLEVIL